MKSKPEPSQKDVEPSFIVTFEKAGFSRYAPAFADPTALAKFNDRVAEFQSGCARV